MILVVTLAAAAPSVAIAYWVVRWLSEGVPLALAVSIVAAWTAAVSVAAAAYGVVAARRLVGPLEDLTKALRAFDPSLGDIGHPALIEAADEPSETADLKRALRGAVERIGRDRAQKEAVLAGLMHDLKTPLVAQQLLIEQLPTLDA
ncbi:MAG: HAMP domain-containing histidine kinase, partial [Nocardiopsis sp. BM-2018]